MFSKLPACLYDVTNWRKFVSGVLYILIFEMPFMCDVIFERDRLSSSNTDPVTLYLRHFSEFYARACSCAMCFQTRTDQKRFLWRGGGGRHESCVRFGIAVGTVGVECDKRLRRQHSPLTQSRYSFTSSQVNNRLCKKFICVAVRIQCNLLQCVTGRFFLPKISAAMLFCELVTNVFKFINFLNVISSPKVGIWRTSVVQMRRRQTQTVKWF